MRDKFSSVLGLLLTGFTAWATGDSRLSILSITLLFIAGSALLVVAAPVERGAAFSRGC